MKLIGAGLPRTGTTSTQAALNALGLRCYHMQEVPRESGHLAAWNAHVAGEPMDWHSLFRGYDATVDAPACFYWQELMEAFPDAKVLLNVRDAESWHRSVTNLMGAMKTIRPMGRLIPPVRKFIALTDGLMEAFVGPERTKEAFVAAHSRHYETVIRSVPEDRLLVFRVQDGWKPLCEFVGCDVPADTPFPHLNEGGDEVRRRLRDAFRLGAR